MDIVKNKIKVNFSFFIYKVLKIVIMCYLYICKVSNKTKEIQNEYEVIHSCIVSPEGEYIKDITDLLKNHNICPDTKKEFFKSIIKDHINVNVHVYLNGDIEIKYIFD